ncbi:MAG: hypothetical protein ACK5EA_22505, partial [Planctomycetaceae bacterium]
VIVDTVELAHNPTLAGVGNFVGPAAAGALVGKLVNKTTDVVDDLQLPQGTPGPTPKLVAPKSFQAAEQGGRHAGFLKNCLGQSSENLHSEAKMLRQRAAEHQDKIAKRIGFGKVSDDPIIQARAEAGRIKHLEKEIQNFLEQAEIAEELARRAAGGGL